MRNRAFLLAVTLAAFSAAYAQTPADHHTMANSGAPMQERPAAPSASLAVTVPGHPLLMLSLADLQSMPQKTVSVFNAHNKQNETYSGPVVADVLARAGLTVSEKTQHAVLDSWVVAKGTDGYFVVFSGAELQPTLHKTQAIIAIAQSGQPLTRTGAFQLIAPGDMKPARWVRNLDALTVNAVPMQR